MTDDSVVVVPAVCMNHWRFVPCRSEGTHRYSSHPADVASVSRYHQGDDE